MSYEIRVYKIYFDDCDDIYIGSTKANLSQRMAQHRTAVRKGSTCRIHNFIRSKDLIFNYILVSSCIVYNKDQQNLFEQTVIDELQPNLNQIRAHTTVEQTREQTKVYNDDHKEARLEHRQKNKNQKKEYDKEYQKEYKESILEKKKVYREKNKESISKQMKVFYNKNKESISEKGKIKIHCPYCDTYIRRLDIKRHIKTNKHKKNLYFHFYNFIHS